MVITLWTKATWSRPLTGLICLISAGRRTKMSSPWQSAPKSGSAAVGWVDIGHWLLPEFVRSAVADPGLPRSTSHPAGGTVGVVVTSFGTFLEEGHPAELRAPDDECILEESALL